MSVKNRKIALIMVCMLSLLLVSCGKDDGSKETVNNSQEIAGFDMIKCVDSLVCAVPSSYRENAISYSEYAKQQTDIESGFDVGVVETKKLDSYRLTDFKTFLFNFYRDANFAYDLFYVNSEADIAKMYNEVAGMQGFSVTGNFAKAEKNGVTKVCADIEFSANLENDRVVEQLKGKVVLIQYEGECYFAIFGTNQDRYDETILATMVNSFNYSGESSDLLGEGATREDIVFVDPTGDQEINVKPSSQWELQENGTLYCADYNAVAAIILMDSSVDRVLTSDEIYSSFAPEGAYNNVELSWTTSVKGSDGQEWVSKSYNVVTDNNHCNTFFATAKERTVAFIECTFANESDRYMVELLLMDLCENAVIQKYIPLNAKKTEEVTTEEGTSEDVSTEETPTEEVPTEETTTEQPTTTEAPTTEAPTTETPTTEAPTTETPTTEQATTQQPSTREPAKPKKPTNSLDVEW